MANYLLDTHTLLWHANKDNLLSTRAYNAITDPANQISISIASYWEMAIKASLGKLALPTFIDEFRRTMEVEGILSLHLTAAHLRYIQNLPYPASRHRDPFDRAIIATAKVEGMIVISRDEHFSDYDLQTLW